MCGVFCKFFNSGSDSALDFLELFDRISHRGPDGEGVYFTLGKQNFLYKSNKLGEIVNNIEPAHYDTAMGHKRLGIIDLSDDGLQPFVDKDFSLVFNGEIFNYIELRQTLIELGCSFETATDTEVVLKSFQYWGTDCFKRFNGMWAICIYDKKTNRVFLSRDRFGIKPLYYQIDNGLVVSSEIKSLSKKKVNINSLAKFLEYNLIDDDSETLFDGILQVEPSTYYEIDNQLNIIKTSYFDVSEELNKTDSSVNYSELLLDSIKLRNRSDVEVGGLLSGGIDSSIIAGATKQLSGSFHAFSSVFDDPKFSEESYIKKTESYLDVDVSYNKPDLSQLSKNVRKQVYIQDSPLRSLAPIYQYQLYSRIKNSTDIRVVLNGQGADEIFSGYHEHILCNLIDILKSGKFDTFIYELNAYSKIRGDSLIKTLSQLPLFILQETTPKLWHLLLPRILNRPCTKAKAPTNLSGRLIYNISKSALPEYLRYEDRNSMAHGIEARLPFLDYRLVLSALKIDNAIRVSAGVAKQPLRLFAKKSQFVSPAVLERKDKTGFISPQHKYMMGPLFEDICEQFDFILSLKTQVFNKKYIKKLKSEFINQKGVNFNKIFRIYTVALWIQEFEVCFDE
ncbi:asparagine synthase (glutamine-hydrolyzing) [Motiliproteus coralliicola]|uniref:asparagine synthase (glutamine-hydrolyzing) n=1 Tax=Motiliproteus coralliicola TaxID=2283196 RepID=A0A369WND7_9GAMM|nr:asparagine synthase (glutamine-hydrolyzing) [Motiliproteus coralliicola]RDE22579.1 asparagine synthase (glutamine-hydrolyzing) [Motiliproteus coralliicola]